MEKYWMGMGDEWILYRMSFDQCIIISENKSIFFISLTLYQFQEIMKPWRDGMKILKQIVKMKMILQFNLRFEFEGSRNGVSEKFLFIS